jgi:hypothetical protein
LHYPAATFSFVGVMIMGVVEGFEICGSGYSSCVLSVTSDGTEQQSFLE